MLSSLIEVAFANCNDDQSSRRVCLDGLDDEGIAHPRRDARPECGNGLDVADLHIGRILERHPSLHIPCLPERAISKHRRLTCLPKLATEH